jgi:hypothetical protein
MAPIQFVPEPLHHPYVLLGIDVRDCRDRLAMARMGGIGESVSIHRCTGVLDLLSVRSIPGVKLDSAKIAVAAVSVVAVDSVVSVKPRGETASDTKESKTGKSSTGGAA